MARYKATAPQRLMAKIKANYTLGNRAASLALNKTATYTNQQSVALITKEVNLPQGYVAKHLRVGSRASPANLSTSIFANERGTLLTRYPYMRTSDGIRVSVNKGSGFREIKGAFRVTGLKGSLTDGIALRNKDAVEFFKRSLSKGQRTSGKTSKLARIIAKAEAKPRGITVLHSRSVNQLFLSVREEVKPKSDAFLIEDFIAQLNRLKNK